MRLRRKKLILFLIVTIFIVTFPQFYWALPIEGTVIDKHTKAPLPGALVMVTWPRKTGWFQATDRGAFEMKEVETDDRGKFRITWSYPKPRLPFQGIPNYGPIIFLFHKNRKLKTYSNSATDRRNSLNPFISSQWNEGTLEAGEIITRDTKEYYKSFASLTYAIDSELSMNSCSWKKIKHLFKEIYKIDLRAKQTKFLFEICPCGHLVTNDCGASNYLKK